MRVGLDVAQHQLLWPELVERVQFAESAGFDGAWVFANSAIRALAGELGVDIDADGFLDLLVEYGSPWGIKEMGA